MREDCSERWDCIMRTDDQQCLWMKTVLDLLNIYHYHYVTVASDSLLQQ